VVGVTFSTVQGDLENLDMSENLPTLREISRTRPKIIELSWKRENFIASFTFGDVRACFKDFAAY